MRDPGLDRHEWETEWADLSERLEEDPAGALSDVDGLVARMMDARGLPLDAADGELEPDAEETRAFASAREVTRRVEAGEDVDPGDVGAAAGSYAELYRALLESDAAA